MLHILIYFFYFWVYQLDIYPVTEFFMFNVYMFNIEKIKISIVGKLLPSETSLYIFPLKGKK